jgi:hypothetical protein
MNTPLLQRTLLYRAVDLACRISERAFGGSRLDGEVIEREALSITGRESFLGERFREPYHMLVEELRRDARLNAMGRVAAVRMLLRALVTRASLEAVWQGPTPDERHLFRPSQPPLFLVGLHRTGTTLLQRLLAADPGSRPLLYWESYYPLRTMHRRPDATTPTVRRRAAIRKQSFYRLMMPALDDIHEIDARGPEECHWLLLVTLISYGFPMQYRLDRYHDWLDGRTEAEWEFAYREYLSMLGLLAGEGDGHWILKCPLHAARIGTLARLLPSAVFVETVREPIAVTGSFCSLTAALRGMGSDAEDLGRTGTFAARFLARTSRDARAGASLAGSRLIRIHYDDLVRNPLDCVKLIYDRAGIPLSPSAIAAMRRTLESDCHSKRPPHRYNLADFGLDAATVSSMLAEDPL